MPVTAKLCRRFYEKFGDDVADELVNWFNQVDTTYRSDLRELNELNFARFDAKLEQRMTELRAEVSAQIGRETNSLRAEMHAGFASQIKWMFVFWMGTTLTLIGTTIGLVKFLR